MHLETICDFFLQLLLRWRDDTTKWKICTKNTVTLENTHFSCLTKPGSLILTSADPCNAFLH